MEVTTEGKRKAVLVSCIAWLDDLLTRTGGIQMIEAINNTFHAWLLARGPDTWFGRSATAHRLKKLLSRTGIVERLPSLSPRDLRSTLRLIFVRLVNTPELAAAGALRQV